jgi:hypothetical protein
MSDAEIRQLERRVASGEKGAWDELRRAKNRAGRGEPVFVADLIDLAFDRPVPLLPCAEGVRAVLAAAGIEAKVSTPPAQGAYSHEFVLRVRPRDRAAIEQVEELFFIAGFGDVASELELEVGEREEDACPKLAPDMQDVFVAAVRAQFTSFAKARKEPEGGFQRGHVVRLGTDKRKGARHVVGRVEPDGKLTLVPLSGTKSRVVVASDGVTLEADQTLRFEGTHRSRHEKAYEVLGRKR